MSAQDIVRSLAGTDKKKQRLAQLMTVPAFSLDKSIVGMTTYERKTVATFMDKVAAKAVVIATYMELRGGSGCGDRGHALALRVAEDREKELRMIQGYPE